MADTFTCPVCPNTLLPEVAFSTQCPENKFGGIDRIVIGLQPMVADPCADPSGWLTELATRSALLEDDVNAIRYLDGSVNKCVKGSTDVTAGTAIEWGKKIVGYTDPTYDVNWQVQDNSQGFYDLMRSFGCNGTYYISWTTCDGDMYGGCGVSTPIQATEPIPESNEEVRDIRFTASFESAVPPVRCSHPTV